MESIHSRSQQRTDQRVFVLTLKFLALKNPGFSPVKNTFQNFFDLFLPLFFANEIIKNGPQKLLIISPKLFFTLLARLPKPAQN